MNIAGLQKMTLLDFPGKVACTAFLQGCNFRCPFCHNYELIANPEELMEEAEFFSFLQKRRGLLQGVCVTGGEPTLQPELPAFLKKIRDLGYSVKLDTNGYRPEVLRTVLEQGLADYVAMDLKNGREAYAQTCGMESLDTEKIRQSVLLLLQESGVAYELRTTLCHHLHDEKTVQNMADWLCSFTNSKVKQLFLQPFVDRDTVAVAGLFPPTAEEMREYKGFLEGCAQTVELRGI